MPIQLVANYITVTDPNEFPGNTPLPMTRADIATAI